MKKSIKISAVSLLALCCVLAAAFSTSAETYYQYYGFAYVIQNNTSVSIAGWDNRSSEVYIPSVIEKREVVSISNDGFNGNEFITKVDFSMAANLTRIGMHAFDGCSAISSPVVLPSKLSVINDSAFKDCTSLPGVTVPRNVKKIPDQCFYNCSSLTDVKLTEGLESIGRIAFGKCSSLRRVNIPKSVTTIHDVAFHDCPNLTLGVWYGTVGYDYAIAQNIPYTLLDNVKLGDVDGDGFVNINDVTHIQRHLAELEQLEGIYFHAADANQDGALDISDATAVQQFLAEYEIEYPIGEVMMQ